MTDPQDAIYRALDALDRKVTEGFDRVERSVENMVTKGEFKATVERLDATDKHLESKMDSGFEDIKQEVAEGFKKQEEQSQARSTKSRWLLGLIVAGAGVLSGFAFDLIRAIIP